LKRSLRRYLRKRGATAAEIENATRHEYLPLLVIDREVLPGPRAFTMSQFAERAGTDLETARALWHAIGFPELPDNLPVFTSSDVEALREFVSRIESGSVFEWTLERALAQARVVSSALARVADALTDELSQSLGMARAAGLNDEELALLVATRLDYEGIAKQIDHVHRVQLRAAVWRRLAGTAPTAPGTITGAVGFVDLVGYTALANELDVDELADLVARFTDLTHDVVVAEGGQIVKMIGDEVMFVTVTSLAAARIAVELTERSKSDEHLPAVRCGVAYGSLLAREGDYFGPVVNLASRLTELARPDSVLASAELVRSLPEDSGMDARRVSLRKIRDIGKVEVCRLRRGTT
jgi:adenylate cyclase